MGVLVGRTSWSMRMTIFFSPVRSHRVRTRIYKRTIISPTICVLFFSFRFFRFLFFYQIGTLWNSNVPTRFILFSRFLYYRVARFWSAVAYSSLKAPRRSQSPRRSGRQRRRWRRTNTNYCDTRLRSFGILLPILYRNAYGKTYAHVCVYLQ